MQGVTGNNWMDMANRVSSSMSVDSGAGSSSQEEDGPEIRFRVKVAK